MCGLDLTDPSAAVCPACEARFVTPSPRSGKIWIAALLQFALFAVFILLFKLPKIMIAFSAGLILVGIALSAWAKSKAAAARPTSRAAIARPLLFKIVSLAIALSSLALVATLLFSFVAFLNSWTRWHTYEGEPYHRAEFQVKHAYYQRGSKGGVYIYASGMVENQSEWMNLQSFVPTLPHNQAELDSAVPAGTSIPIYLFPNLKGRMRVQVYQGTPPAEAYRNSAMNALHYGLSGLALCAALLFIVFRVRPLCFVQPDPQFQQSSFGQT